MVCRIAHLTTADGSRVSSGVNIPPPLPPARCIWLENPALHRLIDNWTRLGKGWSNWFPPQTLEHLQHSDIRRAKAVNIMNQMTSIGILYLVTLLSPPLPTLCTGYQIGCDINPRPCKMGCVIPMSSFWNGRRTSGRNTLKFCIAYGAAFVQLLAKKKKIDRIRSGHGAMTP